MALKDCPECSRSVSSTAVVCPGCGYAVAANHEKDKVVAAARLRQDIERLEREIDFEKRRKEDEDEAIRKRDFRVLLGGVVIFVFLGVACWLSPGFLSVVIILLAMAVGFYVNGPVGCLVALVVVGIILEQFGL